MIIIIICGVVIVVVSLAIFILGPAPADSPLRSYKHLPGQSPIDKLISGSSNDDVALPDIFNEQKIVSQLQQLKDSPTIFDMYVMRLWHKFTSHNEKALLLQWVSTFEVGKKVIDAHIELQRSHNERSRLHLEDKVKRKEADVKLAQLDADMQEAKLRKDSYSSQRKNMKTGSANTIAEPQPSMATDSALGEKQRKLDELQRKKQAEEYRLFNDLSLNDQQRKERLDFLESTYQQEKLKLQVGFGGFEDD